MVGQEKSLNDCGGSAPRSAATGGNVRDLVHEALSLLQLQATLFELDLRDSLKRLILSVALLGGAAVALIACVSIMLVCVAESLVDFGDFRQSTALAAAACVGAGSAIGLALAGWSGLRKGMAAFERSREECRRTVEWIKDALKHPAPTDGRHDGQLQRSASPRS
jgi:hypothetical protein